MNEQWKSHSEARVRSLLDAHQTAFITFANTDAAMLNVFAELTMDRK